MELDNGMSLRTEILQYSLILENVTSIFLASILGIENHEATKSFGNKNGSLSYNQKIDLLIDLGSLSNDEKSKFQTFMEVRNQFTHNYKANNYESCYSYMEGKEKFILKHYPQKDNLSTEEKLHTATIELAKHVLSTTTNLIKVVKEKIGEKVRLEMLEKQYQYSNEVITEIEEIYNFFYSEKVRKNINCVPIEEIKDLGTEIRNIYFRSLSKRFKD